MTSSSTRALALLALAAMWPAAPGAAATFSKHLGGAGFDRGVTGEELQRGGGYIITGYTTSSGAGGEDVVLVRTDPSGDAVWTKTIGGTGKDNGWAVRETDDGGYIVAGFTNSFGAGEMDVYLIRTDTGGDTLWTKTYGGEGEELGWDVQRTADGGFIIAAQTASLGNGEIDAYLIKTDADGKTEWAKTYGGEKVDRIFSVQQTPDGGYVAVGITYSFGAGGRDAYLLKTDGSGEQEWFKTFGGPAYDVGHSVALSNDGGFIITGYGESFAKSGGRNVYLIKTDAKGDEQWTGVYGGSESERGITGLQTRDGGYVAIGFTDRNWDVYLVRTDGEGSMLWTRTFGANDRVDFGYTVRETNDGGFIMTGHTSDFQETESDILLIKTDSMGRVNP